jgi:hypothetical protein
MGRRPADRGSLRKTQRPSVALPPDLDAKTQRKIKQMVDAQWREATGRPPAARRPFRFRFQLVPLCWAAAAMAGLAARASHVHLLAVAIAAAVTVLATVAGTRHRPAAVRKYNQSMAGWAAAWALALFLFRYGPWSALGVTGWAVPSGSWLHRHRWRGPAAEPEKPDTTVEDIWAALCAKQKWHAELGAARPAGAGQQWPIRCDGIETHMGQIAVKRREVAAAFHKSVITCYTEPDPGADDESRGLLTILPRGVLDTPRRWDGAGLDLATGLAVIGRYPDGEPVREAWFGPGLGGGTVHTIIAGAPGSGKTGLIDMGLAISLQSGIVAPVILDPQMGQALPAWRDKVPYAVGTDECMTYLRGLNAAMFDRSQELAGLEWAHPRTGRRVRGFGFYDYWMVAKARAEKQLGIAAAARLAGDQLREFALPITEITIDEAPILLACKGAPALLLDILKLGRKVGFRVRLACQVPSIKELGLGELRSMLVGGNVICFRTGDRVSHGMANIPANPNELPKKFPNGTRTEGLGFAATGDVTPRPSVAMRSDWLEDPYEAANQLPGCPPDQGVAARLAASVEAAGDILAGIAAAADSQARVQLEILGVLRVQGAMTPGQIISATTFKVSEVASAIDILFDTGKVRDAGDDKVEAVAG